MDAQEHRPLRLIERVGRAAFWMLWVATVIFYLGSIGMPIHHLFGITDPPNSLFMG